MNIEIFQFCEFATIRNESLTIVNTFDNWRGDIFQAYCVIKLRCPPQESGDHLFVLEIIDADGSVIFSNNLKLAMPDLDLESSVASVIVGIQTKIRPGHYQCSLKRKSDSEDVVASILLLVRPPQQKQ